MTLVSVTQLSNLGKAAIAAILGFVSLMQIPQVSAPIMEFGHLHPHFASVIAGIMLLGTLLANPQVQKVLNIEASPNSKVTTTVETPAQK